MAKRYNIAFSGQIIAGHDAATVRANLGKVFKADAQTLDKLFSGQPRIIKRDCDEDTARKYKAAMERAGAQPIIEAIAEPEAASAADKIAALAAAPEDERFTQQAPPPDQADTATDAGAAQSRGNTAPDSTVAGQATAAANTEDGDIELAPPETEVLREDERTPPEIREVDTSALSAGEPGERLAQEASPAPSAPDTSHLDMAEAGADIPNLPDDRQPLSPDTGAINLSPEGTDFSDCAGPAPPPPALDLSGMEVAPEGSAVLEERYRQKNDAPAPDTDHIKLED